MSKNRINKTFIDLKAINRKALVSFVTAGDPDFASSLNILSGLPEAGADIVELGMPFSDPMAEGPPIQLASQRALKGGQTMSKTFEMAATFRTRNPDTPLILMGYYNPVFRFGHTQFAQECKKNGVDGVLIVDLPIEVSAELETELNTHDIAFIRLVTPTTDDTRFKKIAEGASGFLYYVAVAGVTGSKTADVNEVNQRVAHFKTLTDIPIVVGFGIKTTDDVIGFRQAGDGIVVGSALVEALRHSLDNGKATEQTPTAVFSLVRTLASPLQAT